MTARFLLRAIDRFVETAKDEALTEAEGRFRRFVIDGWEALRAFQAVSPHETRFLQLGRQSAGLSGTIYSLTTSGMQFIYVDGGSAIEYDHILAPGYLTIRYLVAGENTYSKEGTVVTRAQAGDFCLRTSKSPLFRISTSENSKELLINVPIPAGQHFTIHSRKNIDQRATQFLETGILVRGQTDLLDVHLGYALDYAVESIRSGEAAEVSDRIQGEYLYLLCCQEFTALHGNRDAGQKYAVVPFKLQVAEAFLIKNAARTPSIGEAAAEAGMSTRALHALFDKCRGVSPREFVREQRLLGIRAALQNAKSGSTVTEIAMAWGYHNFGNFAALYKQRFGELPSETLKSGERPAAGDGETDDAPPVGDC
jgi:AraC-like DNA-binding protein